MAFLLYWRGAWGDEGDGYDYTAVFTHRVNAEYAKKNWEPPKGFTKDIMSGYKIVEVPLDPIRQEKRDG